MSDTTPPIKDPILFALDMLMKQSQAIHAIRMALVEHAPRIAQSIAAHLAEPVQLAESLGEPSLDQRIADFLRTYESRKQ